MCTIINKKTVNTLSKVLQLMHEDTDTILKLNYLFNMIILNFVLV